MSSSSSSFSPDHLSSSSERLCYVQCNICNTVLAVSVPCSSLFKTVTVRCGHCCSLLTVPVTMRLPAANQFHLGHSFFDPQNILEALDPTDKINDLSVKEEIRSATPPNMLMNNHHHHQANPNEALLMPIRGAEELPKPPIVNRPPEKRQRVPSAYNRFIKEEIQRIKAGNPDISHREAFSAAAKNWAHFPHIHFGLMPDHQPVKKANMRQQEGEDLLMKDGYFASPNVGSVAPY